MRGRSGSLRVQDLPGAAPLARYGRRDRDNRRTPYMRPPVSQRTPFPRRGRPRNWRLQTLLHVRDDDLNPPARMERIGVT
jgi:hypothetical protein